MVGAIFRLDRINLDGSTALPRVLSLLALWHRRAVTRSALREMPVERLRDIGLNEAEARREAALPFWVERAGRRD